MNLKHDLIRLFTPGPTDVPDQILNAMRQPHVHHRTPEFRQVFSETQRALQQLLDSEHLPLLLTGSGTLGMEASILNLSLAQELVAVVNAGKFGERFSVVAKRLGRNVVELEAEWGSTISRSALENFLKQNSDISVFCVQHCETSTAALHPLHMIAECLQEYAPDALFVVDAISSAAGVEISCKDLGIDALICGSQKAFMLPPGLTMLCLSDRAYRKAASQQVPSLYLDLTLERKAQEAGSSAWTPAIPLVFGLQEALKMINAEGPQQCYSRHEQLAQSTRAFFESLGFELLAKDCLAPVVTAAFPSDGIDAEELRSLCLKQGIRLAGGQDQFKGKIIRVGHMGAMTLKDLESGLAVIAEACSQLRE